MTRHPTAAITRGPGRWAVLAAMTAGAALALALGTRAAETETAPKVAHIPGSRFTYIHRLELFDQEGNPIDPAEEPVLPFSYRHTCNTCHAYDEIRQGWHFNAADPEVPPGRPGQPWFWADQTTGTQIPVSYRDWPNTWHPDDLGLTPWTFIQMFGHHLPGGGPGEMTKVKDEQARWLVSGNMEINCGACHSGDPAYDQVEAFLQVARQNLMWAPAACTSLAAVTGAAAAMPAFYDPVMGPEDDKMAKNAPTITYDTSRFDAKNRVFFNLPNQPRNTRCYFCHTNVQVGEAAPEVWKTDEDVHLEAGLSCTDCHRNGLNHMVTRNYEGEPITQDDPHLATLTCRGCHLGDQSARAGPYTMGSRLGAPVPVHDGLPTIHLDKLACTTCHSGLYPAERTKRAQTSRAHSLEFQGSHRGRHALPYIVEPVFAHRAYDGTIGPQRMVWPAFWTRVVAAEGDEKASTLKPMSPAEVYGMAEDAFKADYETETPAPEGESPDRPADTEEAADADADQAETEPEGEAPEAPEADDEPAEDELEGLTAPQPDLPPAKVKAVLAALGEAEDGPAFGYVCAGKLHTLEESGALAADDHPRAEPVAWPIAHNVRPAEYALGAGSGNAACTVCHGFDAAIVWGEVERASPADLPGPDTTPMYAFQGRDPLVQKAWAMSYLFRPIFKPVGFATAAVIAAMLLAYLVRGMTALARWAADSSPAGPATK